MNLTNPFKTMSPGRMMTKEEIARAIRQDITGEHDAIASYEAHIQTTEDETVKVVLQHIVDEEKMHVAELDTLLEYLDNDQKLISVKGHSHAAALIAGEDA